jgi:hypothetical protein
VIIAGGEDAVRSKPVGSNLSVALILLSIAALVAIFSLSGCSKPPEPAATPAADLHVAGLEAIPPADRSKYPKIQDMSTWQNPYLVVRDDGIGFVDLSNHEVHILTPEQVQAELVALPSNAWPYGRVVLVTEAAPKIPTEQAKADLRKNRGLLAGTLKELGVQIQEAP